MLKVHRRHSQLWFLQWNVTYIDLNGLYSVLFTSFGCDGLSTGSIEVVYGFNITEWSGNQYYIPLAYSPKSIDKAQCQAKYPLIIIKLNINSQS